MNPPVTRGFFLRRSGQAALAAAGLYSVIDGLTAPPARAAGATHGHPREQHVLQGLRTFTERDVEAIVPPVHHQIITARVEASRSKADLVEAQVELERALARVDAMFPSTATGLGVTVGWGGPYFHRLVPRLADGRRFPHYLPLDRRASRAAGRPLPALLESPRFPSDPEDVVLERNDVCVLLRSDSLRHIAAGTKEIFTDLAGLLSITSVRRGFVGSGVAGEVGLPKHMALRAGVPGAELIPDAAQLFLGFTSTQTKALGPERIANLETLPALTDQWPHGYFRYGTTMHVSHLFEDLEMWYARFSYIRRVWAAFRPGLSVPDGTRTVPEGPLGAETLAHVSNDARDLGLIGHSGALQPATRLDRDTVDNYGVKNARGTAVIQRGDFNTLDNPFFWSARPTGDGMSDRPAAGLHFVAFAATSDSFHRARRAMDGRYPDGSSTPFRARQEEQGLNSILRTTHRQNFLVPPRRHRAFPLAELL
ncbi:MAG: hypothetical protein ACJ77E_02460 [Gaiellaceae bacterium]